MGSNPDRDCAAYVLEQDTLPVRADLVVEFDQPCAPK